MPESLNDKSKFQLIQSTKLIDEIIQNGNQALEKFPTDYYDLELFIFINLLDRFTAHLSGINHLLKEYENNPNLETSIGLIARAGLLDFMIITYISTYQTDINQPGDDSDKRYKQQLNNLLCDQVIYTFRFTKEAKNTGLISNQDYNAVIESTVHNYSFLFADPNIDYNKPEEKLLGNTTISPLQLFRRIHSHPLTTRFSTIYDLYTYYSKYEHFGIMTHFMQRQGMDIDLERIFGAIQYLIKGMGATFRYLSVSPYELRDQITTLDKLEDLFIAAVSKD